MHGAQEQGGYSLYELLLSLALLSIVLGAGLPSLGFLLADKRLHAEASALFHAAHLARKESIVRRRVVTICASADGETCDPAERWSIGWIMFANATRADEARRDAEDDILWRHTVDESVQIVANRSYFAFRTVHLRAVNGTLRVCDVALRADSRAVVISHTGRPRVARRDTRGRPYRCAQ